MEKDRLEIPTVTEADLHHFHQSLFGTTHHLPASSTAPPHPEAEDDLGYYSDGQKRTLTDEQIVMFRHTEIQKLLSQRNAAQQQSLGAVQATESSTDRAQIAPQKPSSRSEGVEEADDDHDEGEEEEEEEEYARFLESERREFEKIAAQKRNGERSTYDPGDRTVSTRRRVREMDDISTNDDVLTYDDGPATAMGDARTGALGREGKKIWFPMIG